MAAPASVSFVIPCLNEAKTLPFVFEKIALVRSQALVGREVEVILSDNGSTDGSIELAKRAGITVLSCEEKGYGAALKNGISGARGEIVIFADADNTYDFTEAPKLIAELENGFDMVIGSRLRGTIHLGAMPFLHRYLGTPVLTTLINVLYRRGGATKLTDCNSGFRCFKKSAYLRWGVESSGMEFASEMLVKALRHGSSISQVPISLHPDVRDRAPHLRTWRDGMRHLLQIFVEAPGFFSVIGIAAFVLSWFLLLVSLFLGPFHVGQVSIFGLHTMLFALLGTCLAVTSWSIGLYLSLAGHHRKWMYNWVLHISEDRLFWSLVGLTSACLAMVGIVFRYWAQNGFEVLSLEKQVVAMVTFSLNGLLLVTNVFTAHLMKRLEGQKML